MKYFVSFLAVVGLFGSVILGYFFKELEKKNIDYAHFDLPVTTQFYDKNGNLLANVFEENRFFAPYEEIPEKLIEALLAIEDTNFFEHSGVNIDAIARAFAKDIATGRLAQGASTLTQQLVKNHYLSNEKSLKRKINEALISYEIEQHLSKEQILERYLNSIFLGHGYYGIKTAARGYFHKELGELSLKEMAILVGLPKAPSVYDPTKRLDLSLSRANAVLRRMYELGWISKEEYKQNVALKPIVYDESLTQNKAPYVVDEAIRQLKAMGIDDIKSGGYQVKLSIDLPTQLLAQEALKYGYDEIIERDQDIDLDQINGAMVVSDPATGMILALVGGVDYSKSSFNRATMSRRQLGSSFKPFVYLSAISLGYSPKSEIADVARVFDTVDKDGNKMIWKPKNYASDYKGVITLKEALTKSRNLATINLLLDISLNKVHSFITNLGFKDVPKDLSIGLGSFGVSPYEYAGMYSIISNYGRYQPVRLITEITDKYGNKIELPELKDKRFVPSEQGFLLVDMMQNVVQNGTGKAAKMKDIEIAGKTGTSNKNIDAWFVGFSPRLQVITWYGNDNNLPMSKFEGGARSCAPVFKYFMSRYEKMYPFMKREFYIPPRIKKQIIGGETWYYTNHNPLPKPKRTDIVEQQEEDGLLF